MDQRSPQWRGSSAHKRGHSELQKRSSPCQPNGGGGGHSANTTLHDMVRQKPKRMGSELTVSDQSASNLHQLTAEQDSGVACFGGYTIPKNS